MLEGGYERFCESLSDSIEPKEYRLRYLMGVLEAYVEKTQDIVVEYDDAESNGKELIEDFKSMFSLMYEIRFD